MNHYQREVAEMDRRHRLVVRALSFAGAASLVIVALWSAGLPPTQGWASVQAWLGESKDEQITPAIAQQPAAPESINASVEATPPAPSVLSGTESSIASTRQPLYLISTAPGRNKNEGTARIGTSRENPQTYVAGAILVNGARLAEIHSDRVVLARGDETITLLLAFGRNAGREVRTQESIDLATVPAMSANRAQAELLKGDAFGEVIRSMAYYENDQLQGLQVFPGRQSGTFARLGLKPADVIVAADSLAVTDAQVATEYLQGLAQGAVISVSVRRGSAVHTVALDGALFEPESSKTSGLARTFP